MHNFALPTELALEKLITQVYEAADPIDQNKLSTIESQILQKAKRNNAKNLNKIPWWIVLVLAGGFATAAWWVGDVLIEAQDTEITNKQSPSSDNIRATENRENNIRSESADEDAEDQTYDDHDSPIIYQRESY